MKTRMSLLAAGALIGMAALAPPPVAASQGPWCASQPAGPGGLIEDCRFRTFDQCRSEVIAGNRGVCIQNPRWPGWWQQQAQRRRR